MMFTKVADLKSVVGLSLVSIKKKTKSLFLLQLYKQIHYMYFNSIVCNEQIYLIVYIPHIASILNRWGNLLHKLYLFIVVFTKRNLTNSEGMHPDIPPHWIRLSITLINSNLYIQ